MSEIRVSKLDLAYEATMYMPVFCKISLAIYPCTSDHSGRSLTQKKTSLSTTWDWTKQKSEWNSEKKRAMILVNISNTTGEQ